MMFKRSLINDLSANVTDGEHASVKDDENGAYFLLSNKNIKSGKIVYDEYDRKISESTFLNINRRTKLSFGDVVISTVGSIGKTAVIKDDFINFDFQRSVGIIKPDQKKLNAEYLHYYFQIPTVQKRLVNLSKGAVQKCLFISDLRGIEIDHPTNIEDQEVLVAVLKSIDSKIELNNRINADLEAMAKTIYDYWFVQFDFPDKKGKPYKTSGGKMVWNEELKREVPEGWEVKELGQILRTELGGTPSTKEREFWDGDFPWLNSGEIANFPIIDSELKITEAGIKSSATTLMPKGTCVLSITRHLRPSILGVDSCANQSVIGIFESEKIKKSFIYPYLVNDIPRLMTLRSGAQQPHINKGTVDVSKMIIPIDQVLDQYYQVVDAFYNKILNNAFQTKHLTELRDWLLPMLMNGQVRVG